jgi:GT2 family glycosyltransferase
MKIVTRSKPARKLWVVTPTSREKNYGGAIMDEVSGKNSADWILIRDGDMMFLTPDWVEQIHQLIDAHGDNYHIIGCMTNRLNIQEQLHGGNMSGCWDMQKHYEIAQKRWKDFKLHVVDVDEVAAVCMLMQVGTLEALGMPENDIYFDRKFCAAAKYNGLQIGVALGLYVFHSYRPWSADPGKDIKHLL